MQSISDKYENTGFHFIISAQSIPALQNYVQNYINFLKSKNTKKSSKAENQILGDICYTLQISRKLFTHIVLIEVRSMHELITKLEQQDYKIQRREEISNLLKYIASLKSAHYQKISLPSYPFQRQCYNFIHFDLLTDLHRSYPQMLTPKHLSGYQQGVAWLDQQALAFIQQAWRTLQLPLELENNLSLQDITKNIIPSQQRLALRLVQILCQQRYLEKNNGDNYRIIKPFNLEPATHLSASSSILKIEWILLQRCGRALVNILQGTEHPLELLFPQEDAISAATLYHEGFANITFNRLLMQAVKSQVSAYPTNKIVKILEIGA